VDMISAVTLYIGLLSYWSALLNSYAWHRSVQVWSYNLQLVLFMKPATAIY